MTSITDERGGIFRGVSFFGTASGLRMVGTGCFEEHDPDLLAYLDFRRSGALTRSSLAPGESLWFLLPSTGQPDGLLLLGQARYAKDDVGRDGFVGCVAATERASVLTTGYDAGLNLIENLLNRYVSEPIYTGSQRVDFESLRTILPQLSRFYDGRSGQWRAQSRMLEVSLPRGWRSRITTALLMSLIGQFEEACAPLLENGYILRESTGNQEGIGPWQFDFDFIDNWYQEIITKPRDTLANAVFENRRLKADLATAQRDCLDAKTKLDSIEENQRRSEGLIRRLEGVVQEASVALIIKKDQEISDLRAALGRLSEDSERASRRIEGLMGQKMEAIRLVKTLEQTLAETPESPVESDHEYFGETRVYRVDAGEEQAKGS